MAPVPTPEILWRKPPVLALVALPGVALGRLGEPSTASSAAWVAAGATVRAWTPVFIHGDLHVDHVFVAGDEVTGVIDWSEASQGDALFDLATLTLGHPEHLGDVVAAYNTDVDRDLIRAWWSLRCLSNIRWLVDHGFGSLEDMPEVAVLRSRP